MTLEASKLFNILPSLGLKRVEKISHILPYPKNSMKSKSVLSPAYEVPFNIWDLCVLPIPLSPQQLFQSQVKIRTALSITLE